MSTVGRAMRATSLTARAIAGAIAIGRLARAATAQPPVRPTLTPAGSIGVVVPARDEAARIGPLLAALADAEGVAEIVVVDDQSSDDTATIARAAGVRVVDGEALPAGWVGKAWALHQGIRVASSDWIVTLDADTRPDPRLPTALVARALGDRYDLLTVGGRFECPTVGSRWLHPAMLTTLVYRFGPPGTSGVGVDRAMANGQCMAFSRQRLLDAGGMELVRAEVVEDIALARRLAARGWRVGFLDASELLTVRMFESFTDVARGWGRSIALPGVEAPRHQLVDLLVVVLAQVLPLQRLLTRRGDLVDVVLAAARLGTVVGTRHAYTRGGIAYWSSPLADPLAALAIIGGIARRGTHVWRGRSYAVPPRGGATSHD